MITRREFGKAAVTGSVAGVVMLGSGCPSASQWEAIVLADLPAILQVITEIISIAHMGVVPPALTAQVAAWGAQITTDLNLVNTLVAQYKANADQTLLGKIDAALVDAQTNLSAILAAFHIENPTIQNTVAAAVGLVITTVIAIQALVPPPPGSSNERLNLHTGNGDAAIRQAFNLILAGHYPQAVIK